MPELNAHEAVNLYFDEAAGLVDLDEEMASIIAPKSWLYANRAAPA